MLQDQKEENRFWRKLLFYAFRYIWIEPFRVEIPRYRSISRNEGIDTYDATKSWKNNKFLVRRRIADI